MDASMIASSTMCLLVQNDVMLTLELVRAGANVNQKDLRYCVNFIGQLMFANHIFTLIHIL
jgi:hypothetical protein